MVTCQSGRSRRLQYDDSHRPLGLGLELPSTGRVGTSNLEVQKVENPWAFLLLEPSN